MKAVEMRQQQLVYRLFERNLPSLEVVAMIAMAGSFDWFFQACLTP
jgi:hypothetical protein